MKSIERRLKELEHKKEITELDGIDIVIVSSKEQVDHPERFKKILDSEETSESGFTNRMFHYERK